MHGTGPWEVILVVGTGSELVPAAFVGVGPCPSDEYATSGLEPTACSHKRED